MEGFDHFTHLAPFYDRAIPFTALKTLRRYGGFTGEELVLDAGGGTGRVASSIKLFVRKVFVADLSIGMLRQAFQKGLASLQTQAEDLPFPSETFDRIFLIDVLHHVINQAQTAHELWRVLKPDGSIIIEEPDVRRFPVKIVALAERVLLMRSHFLPPPEITDLFGEFSSSISVGTEGLNVWIVIRK